MLNFFLVIAAASFLAPRSVFLVTVVADSAIAHLSFLNAGDVLFLHNGIAAFYIILPEATAEATTETTAAAARINFGTFLDTHMPVQRINSVGGPSGLFEAVSYCLYGKDEYAPYLRAAAGSMLLAVVSCDTNEGLQEMRSRYDELMSAEDGLEAYANRVVHG